MSLFNCFFDTLPISTSLHWWIIPHNWIGVLKGFLPPAAITSFYRLLIDFNDGSIFRNRLKVITIVKVFSIDIECLVIQHSPNDSRSCQILCRRCFSVTFHYPRKDRNYLIVNKILPVENLTAIKHEHIPLSPNKMLPHNINCLIRGFSRFKNRTVVVMKYPLSGFCIMADSYWFSSTPAISVTDAIYSQSHFHLMCPRKSLPTNNFFKPEVLASLDD